MARQELPTFCRHFLAWTKRRGQSIIRSKSHDPGKKLLI
jgi:hypothetical protein